MKSKLAILDVTTGRNALLKRVNAGERIPIIIRGTITSAWGHDDGISREFTVEVTDLSESKG